MKKPTSKSKNEKIQYGTLMNQLRINNQHLSYKYAKVMCINKLHRNSVMKNTEPHTKHKLVKICQKLKKPAHSVSSDSTVYMFDIQKY